MNRISINPFIENLSVTIGFQKDHNKTELVFDGLNTVDDKMFYLDLSLSSTEHQLIPLVENKWIVTSTFTDKARVFNAQIVEKIDGKMIGHSPIFQLRVRHSIDGTEKIKEVIPPAFKNEYDKMVNVTAQIKDAYDKGELKDEKGADGKSAYQVALDNGYEGTEQQWLDSLKYQHSEEFTQIVNEVRGNAEKAENSKNLALQSATQAEQFKQATETIKNEVETKVSQFNDNVEIQNQALDLKLQQAYTNIGESVKQATEQANRAEQATSSKLDKNHGPENKGKVLTVGDDGNVVPTEFKGGDDNKLMGKVEPTENPSVKDSYEAPFVDLKIHGKSTQNKEENIVPSLERIIPIISKRIKVNNEYVELRSLKETGNLFDLVGQSMMNLLSESGFYRKIDIPINIKVNVNYSFSYDQSIIPPNIRIIVNIVDSVGEVIKQVVNLNNLESNVEMTAPKRTVDFVLRKYSYIGFTVHIAKKVDGVLIENNTDVFKEFWYTKILKNIMIYEATKQPTSYIPPTPRDYKIVDHVKKESKIVRHIKKLDLSTVSYEWQKGIDDKPYSIGNYVYTINDGLKGPWYYVIADRAKVYPYTGFQDKMEDGLCNTQYGIMNVVNGIKTKEEYDVWINKNPINILYALGTPTEETIPYLENDSIDYGLSFQDTTIPSPTLPSELKSVEVSEVKVVGKNLLNIEKIGVDTPYQNIGCYITRDIVLSVQKKPTVTKPIWRFMAISKDGTRQYIEDSMGVISFKATSENPIVQIQYRSLGITGGAYEGIMFEYGTVPTDYEPYKEQVVTLSNPITMSSTLNNKIADIIDINEGMITKNLTIIHAMNKKLDTTEGWIYNDETITYATRKDDYLKGPIGGCNSFDVSTNISYMDNYGNITLIPKPSFITNIDEWLEYVKDKDYYFLLPLKNPTTEALPQEDVEQLKKLKTFTGTTNVVCDAPISFEYEKSIQIVIDELVKAIQKQTNSIENIEREILENV